MSMYTSKSINSSKKTSLIHYANTDYELDTLMKSLADDKCTVVFFFLPWCGACQRIAPFVEDLSRSHPRSLFIKADADKCVQSTKRNNVARVPLFILYKDKAKVDRIEGPSPSVLENKIRFIEQDLDYKVSGGVLPKVGGVLGSAGVKISDVSPFLDKKNCRCVNDLLPTGFQGFLDGKKLASGKGAGRLLLVYTFVERMFLQSIKVKAPVSSGPRNLKIFVNLDNQLDFSVVDQMTPTHEITLSEQDLNGEHSIDIRSGGLIGVRNLQIYIPQSTTKTRQIEIDQMILYGTPLSLTGYTEMELENFAALEKQTARQGTSSGRNKQQQPFAAPVFGRNRRVSSAASSGGRGTRKSML